MPIFRENSALDTSVKGEAAKTPAGSLAPGLAGLLELMPDTAMAAAAAARRSPAYVLATRPTTPVSPKAFAAARFLAFSSSLSASASPVLARWLMRSAFVNCCILSAALSWCRALSRRPRLRSWGSGTPSE